jgi:excisionase family DNA binding protein
MTHTGMHLCRLVSSLRSLLVRVAAFAYPISRIGYHAYNLGMGANVMVREASSSLLDGGDHLLTVTEVSRALSIHRALVVSWIASGELLAIDLGRASLPYWKIKRSDLDAFLAVREARSGAARARVEAGAL